MDWDNRVDPGNAFGIGIPWTTCTHSRTSPGDNDDHRPFSHFAFYYSNPTEPTEERITTSSDTRLANYRRRLSPHCLCCHQVWPVYLYTCYILSAPTDDINVKRVFPINTRPNSILFGRLLNPYPFSMKSPN